MKQLFDTREAWLTMASVLINERVFDPSGIEMPADIKVSCGFPPGKRGGKEPAVACDPKFSAGGHWEIFVNPTLADPARVLGALTGALASASGVDRRMASFKRLISTMEGAATDLVSELGTYPHDAMDFAGRKRQSTRMLKACCSECGFTVRLSRKWASVGAPLCPTHLAPMNLIEETE